MNSVTYKPASARCLTALLLLLSFTVFVPDAGGKERPDARFLKLWSYGNYRVATAEIEMLVDRYPENELFRLNQGALLMYLDSLELAEELLLELMPQDPYLSSRRQYFLGQLSKRRGDDAVAVSRLRTAWKQYPEDLKPLEEAVELSYGFTNRSLCQQLVEELLAGVPASAAGLMYQGLLALPEHPWQAVASLRASVEQFPHPEALLELIQQLEQLPGRYLEAEQYRGQLQRLYPGYPAPATDDVSVVVTGTPEATSGMEQIVTPARKPSCRALYPVGTQYTYSVAYGVIPLGTLKIWTQRLLLIEGELMAEVWFTADSNPLYGWLIDMHDVFVAQLPISTTGLYSMHTSSIYNNEIMERLYLLDHDSHSYIARGCHYQGDIYLYQFPCPLDAFDGISLLFAARRSVRLRQPQLYTTIVQEEFKHTMIELDTHESQMWDQGKRVPVLHLYGTANYRGEAGLSGSFEGWFSTDSLALPLKSKMKILLGSITVRLKEVTQLDSARLPLQQKE
ncbi:MAG: hypothetical protein ISR91_03680 [Candidatus Delongbacteria bacterium]|nr:hypothetical protein [Candidatus Delongbacteria bacterium]